MAGRLPEPQPVSLRPLFLTRAETKEKRVVHKLDHGGSEMRADPSNITLSLQGVGRCEVTFDWNSVERSELQRTLKQLFNTLDKDRNGQAFGRPVSERCRAEKAVIWRMAIPWQAVHLFSQ